MPLYARGVAPLQGLRDALGALGACAAWGARRADPAPVAIDAAADEPAAPTARRVRLEAPGGGRGVAVPEGRLVEPAAAGAAAAELGFPVAVKLCSADLPHKADAGALALSA